MIKCDKGNTIINGKSVDLLAELSTLIHHMLDQFVEAGASREEAKEMLTKAVNNGFMTEEELDEKLKENVRAKLLEPKDALDRLLEIMEKAFAKEDDNGRDKG